MLTHPCEDASIAHALPLKPMGDEGCAVGLSEVETTGAAPSVAHATTRAQPTAIQPRISPHALVRYLERHQGIDVNAIRLEVFLGRSRARGDARLRKLTHDGRVATVKARLRKINDELSRATALDSVVHDLLLTERVQLLATLSEIDLELRRRVSDAQVISAMDSSGRVDVADLFRAILADGQIARFAASSQDGRVSFAIGGKQMKAHVSNGVVATIISASDVEDASWERALFARRAKDESAKPALNATTTEPPTTPQKAWLAPDHHPALAHPDISISVDPALPVEQRRVAWTEHLHALQARFEALPVSSKRQVVRKAINAVQARLQDDELPAGIQREQTRAERQAQDDFALTSPETAIAVDPALTPQERRAILVGRLRDLEARRKATGPLDGKELQSVRNAIRVVNVRLQDVAAEIKAAQGPVAKAIAREPRLPAEIQRERTRAERFAHDALALASPEIAIEVDPDLSAPERRAAWAAHLHALDARREAELLAKGWVSPVLLAAIRAVNARSQGAAAEVKREERLAAGSISDAAFCAAHNGAPSYAAIAETVDPDLPAADRRAIWIEHVTALQTRRHSKPLLDAPELRALLATIREIHARIQELAVEIKQAEALADSTPPESMESLAGESDDLTAEPEWLRAAEEMQAIEEQGGRFSKWGSAYTQSRGHTRSPDLGNGAGCAQADRVAPTRVSRPASAADREDDVHWN